MDFGAAFWIFVFLIILLSMFAGGSSKSSTKSNGPSPDAPRRDIKRETATIAPDRAQAATRGRASETDDRRSAMAPFERMSHWG